MSAVGGLLGLLLWGTVVGLDLITFPQVLLCRPLVAAAGAGLLLGDLQAALEVGIVLELFALDVLPVGASRYPDFGPAAIGAATFMAHRTGSADAWLGIAVGYGLLGAVIGGVSLRLVRLLNTKAARRASASLAAGDQRLVRLLHWRGVVTDLIRGALVTALLVTVAVRLADALPDLPDLAPVSALAIGAGVAAAAGGAVRSAGRGARQRWLMVGLGLGLLVALTS